MRGANNVSMAVSSIGAAQRIRAPEAAPPTSATASQSSRARGEAGSSRKPRPPAESQSVPSPLRRLERRSGKAKAMHAPTSFVPSEVEGRFPDPVPAPPDFARDEKNGRESCWERGVQYV